MQSVAPPGRELECHVNVLSNARHAFGDGRQSKETGNNSSVAAPYRAVVWSDALQGDRGCSRKDSIILGFETDLKIERRLHSQRSVLSRGKGVEIGVNETDAKR
jgi:hypothetical protein